jgi:hypothetical protein
MFQHNYCNNVGIYSELVQLELRVSTKPVKNSWREIARKKHRKRLESLQQELFP